MKKLIYILFLIPLIANSQIDTIEVNNNDTNNLEKKDSVWLISKPVSKRTINYTSSFIDSMSVKFKEKIAEIFVTNNFNNDSGLVVKWIANSIYREDGFDLYRRKNDDPTWTKINTTPFTLTKKFENDNNLNSEEQSLYDFTVQSSFSDFQTSLPRVFVIIKSIYNNYLASLIGIIHFDKNAEKGNTYQYKLLAASSNLELGISEKFVCGDYVKPSPPDSIQIERFKKRCEIKWKPEIHRYYGVDIYRKTNDSNFVKITKTPRAIQKGEDKNGNITFPEVCYVDETINKDFNYTYKFVAIDYFGKESVESDEIFVAKKDFDPPEKPFNLIPTKHDSKMTVDLKWNFIPEDDLSGFNVYRSRKLEGPYEQINFQLIPKNTSYFNDKVDVVGDYYYYCSSIDFSGNESFSGKIYVQVRDMMPPKAPKNLTSETGPGFINLIWDENNEPDLKGYFIQRSLNDEDNSDNHFININSEPTIENKFSQKLAKNVRNKFVYRVVAVDTSFNRSKPSINSLAQMPDVTPPNNPVITDAAFIDSYISVQWIPNIESDLEGYEIYRKSKNDSTEYKKINNLLIPKDIQKYKDRLTQPGEEYFYVLKARDINGNISDFSNKFFAYNPSEKLTSNVNFNLEFNEKKKRVTLNWSLENQEIPVIGSVVYRSFNDSFSKPYTKLINENSFIDNITFGSYTYQIRVFSKEGTVIKSENKNVEFLKNNNE